MPHPLKVNKPTNKKPNRQKKLPPFFYGDPAGKPKFETLFDRHTTQTNKPRNHENAPETRLHPRNRQTPRDLWEGVQDLCIFTSTTGHHREHRTACEMGGGEGVSQMVGQSQDRYYDFSGRKTRLEAGMQWNASQYKVGTTDAGIYEIHSQYATPQDS